MSRPVAGQWKAKQKRVTFGDDWDASSVEMPTAEIARIVAAAPLLLSVISNELRWLRSANFDAGNRDAHAAILEAAVRAALDE